MFKASLSYILQGTAVVSTGFSGYVINNYKSDPSLSLVDNAWRLFDNGNILDRNSPWSPLLGFWVAGKENKKKKKKGKRSSIESKRDALLTRACLTFHP